MKFFINLFNSSIKACYSGSFSGSVLQMLAWPGDVLMSTTIASPLHVMTTLDLFFIIMKWLNTVTLIQNHTLWFTLCLLNDNIWILNLSFFFSNLSMFSPLPVSAISSCFIIHGTAHLLFTLKFHLSGNGNYDDMFRFPFYISLCFHPSLSLLPSSWKSLVKCLVFF